MTAALIARHPRHCGLAALVVGLASGPRIAPAAIAGFALALSAAAALIDFAGRRAAALAIGACMPLGALIADVRLEALERTALRAAFGTEVTGDVTVLAPPRRDPFGGLAVDARFRGERVLLRVPRWARAAPPETVGAIVAVRGALQAPDGAAHARHAHAVLRADALRPAGRRRGGVAGAIDSVRVRGQRTLARGLPDAQTGLARGMVLGDDAALDEDLRDDFRASGLAHLVAASGQNVMLLAALAFAAGMAAGLGIQSRRLLVLALIALYVPLAGAGPSIQRAGIMGAAAIVALLASRPAARWYAVLVAAALTLVADPRALADPGWQMSFAAVVAIMALAGKLAARLRAARWPHPVAEAAGITVAATLATAPFAAAHFDRVSLAALPANVLAVPAVAPVMWLGMTAAALGQVAPALGAVVAAASAMPLGYLTWLGHAGARWPGAELNAPWPLVALACSVALTAVAWAGRARGAGNRAPPAAARRRRRVLAAAALVVTLLVVARPGADGLRPPRAGVLRVTVLDVGQGDATLVQGGGATVLVDAGPAGGPILARLREAGVGRIDALVVTHGSADHVGGAPDVLRRIAVGMVVDGRDGDRSAVPAALDPALRGRRRIVPVAGRTLAIGSLVLDIRWPLPGPPPAEADPNDRAVVAEVRVGARRALLTADAESNVLAGLDLQAVDVLKVSHHGSADPGLPGLLDRLRPRVAVIPVGRHNTYGHPAPSTLAALRSVPEVRRTDRDGTVRVEAGPAGVRVWTSAE